MTSPLPFPALLAAFLCLFLHPATADFDGEGEVDLFRKDNKDVEAMAKLALKHKEDRVAAAALSMALRPQAKNLNQASVDLLAAFAERPQGVDRAAVIIACMQGLAASRQGLVDDLAAHASPEARMLAAASVTARNQLLLLKNHKQLPRAGNDYLIPKKVGRPAPTGTAPAGTGKGKGGSAPKPLQLPVALYADNDPRVVLLALVAGAYEGNPAHAEAVATAKATGPQAAGARLLYAARTDLWPDTPTVQKLFKASLAKPKGPTRRPGAHKGPAPFPWTALPPGGALASLALGQSGRNETAALLNAALRHPELPVRMEALRALRVLKASQALPALGKMIPDCSWPELVEICAFVRALPDKRIIPSLIRRLDSEHGRLRLDLVYTLSALTGGAHASDAPGWITWWKANGAALQIDPGAVRSWVNQNGFENIDVRPRGFFYGLPIHSDRFVYALDSSASMKGSRVESLRENLISSLSSLNPAAESPQAWSTTHKVRYNMIDFGGDVVTLAPELIEDLKKGTKRAESFPLTLGTRSYDGLERAIQQEEADSIFFLSDGAPVWGQLQHWTSVMNGLTLLTAYRPVAIHAVAFSPSKTNETMMKKLPRMFFGRYEDPGI